MQHVLIVEDSVFQAQALQTYLSREIGLTLDIARDFEECQQFIDGGKTPYLAVLLDLHVPGAAPSALVDYVIGKGIPTIVFTSEFSDESQDAMWSRPIVDYVLKGDNGSMERLAELLRRLQKNSAIKIMVVDDSAVARSVMANLLRVHQYQVLEAASGEAALELLSQNSDTMLAMIDFNMPQMDGFQLVQRIREHHSRRRLSVVGISAEGNSKLSARFIKYGANDFIKKPFSVDEFYCRITQNVEMMEYAREIREAAITDALTGLRNRRYFHEIAQNHVARAKRAGETLAVAIMDLDRFKLINDTYGHQTGDEVLRHVAQLMQTRLRKSDALARLGGEEFGLSMPQISGDNIHAIFDALRQRIEDHPPVVDGTTIPVTVSIGVCAEPCETLDEMLAIADRRLYQAKAEGRNAVVFRG